VCQAARSVRIPVVGLGGIASGVDAAEFLIAGATAVEVGTATFWDPRAPLRIAEELAYFLRRQKVARVTELVGSLKL
jgi:dihydroorotate dehydrogenase (NAD+) catalytic subunit